MTFMQARYFTRGRLKKIRVFVIHDMEWPEKPDAAEGCARMFAGERSPRGSAHYCIDNNSWVQSVKDGDTAWGAPQVNADGLHFEHAGYAAQDRKDWADPYSAAELKISARLVAAKCHEYAIPPTHLTDTELRAGKKGIIGHVQASRVYGGSHWDPGPGFPWDTYMNLVRKAYSPKPPVPKPEPVDPDVKEPKEELMASPLVFARNVADGKVYQVITTNSGLRAAHVLAYSTLAEDLQAGGTMIDYTSEAALIADFPLTVATVSR